MRGLVDILTVLPLSPTRYISIYSGRDSGNIMQELDIKLYTEINPLGNQYRFSISIGNIEM